MAIGDVGPADLSARLVLVLYGTDRQDLCLSGIQVVDANVDVGLLWPLGTRPQRQLVVLHLLEAQARMTTAVTDDDPVVLSGSDLPPDQGGVELSQSQRLGTVKDGRAKTRDSTHRPTLLGVDDKPHLALVHISAREVFERIELLIRDFRLYGWPRPSLDIVYSCVTMSSRGSGR